MTEKIHWLCVSEVTSAAREMIRRVGGRCLDLSPDTSTFVMVMLRVDVPEWGLIFWDEGYNINITVGSSENDTVTLYSRNIASTLIQESLTDLVLCIPDEWQEYKARIIAESNSG